MWHYSRHDVIIPRARRLDAVTNTKSPCRAQTEFRRNSNTTLYTCQSFRPALCGRGQYIDRGLRALV